MLGNFRDGWQAVGEGLVEYHKEVQHKPYIPGSFQPQRCMISFLLAWLGVVALLAVYYLGWAELCSDSLEVRSFGDPSCHTVYDDAFAVSSWERRAQLFSDTAILPIAHLLVTVDPQHRQWLPGQCLWDVKRNWSVSDLMDYYAFSTIRSTVRVNYEAALKVTMIEITAEVSSRIDFQFNLNGVYLYNPQASLPRIPNGIVGSVLFVDRLRDEQNSTVLWRNITADQMAIVMRNFLLPPKMRAVLGEIMGWACLDFQHVNHIQQCTFCGKLDTSVALPLLASNAVTAAQILLTLCVLFVHWRYPAKGRSNTKSEPLLSADQRRCRLCSWTLADPLDAALLLTFSHIRLTCEVMRQKNCHLRSIGIGCGCIVSESRAMPCKEK